MSKKEIPGLIPFSIASGLVLIHIVGTLLTPGYTNDLGGEVTYLINDDVKYTGIGLLMILLLILLKKSLWKYLFALLLILALSPIISLYHHELSVGIMGLNLELKTLGLLILHFVLNRDIVPSVGMSVKAKEKTAVSREADFEAAVDGFVSRFRNKSAEELESMTSDTSFVLEATEAARRLLQKQSK